MADTVATRISVERADEAIAKLRQFGSAGSASFRQVEEASGRLSGRAGANLQNFSFQFTDFLVQVQGGTSAIRAFSQQAPQLLGGFGPIGAAAGLAAVGITGVATAIFGVNRTSEDTPRLLDSASDSFGTASSAAAGLAEDLRTASTEGRRLLATFADLDRQTATKAAGEALGSLADTIRDRVQVKLQEQNFDQLIGTIPEERGGAIADIGRQAAAQAGNIEGQLRAAIESGDPEQVRQILNREGVVTDDASAQLAKSLIDAAQKVELADLVSEGNQAALEAIAKADDKPTKASRTTTRRDPIADATASFADFRREVDLAVSSGERLLGAAQESTQFYRDMILAVQAEEEATRAVEAARKDGVKVSEAEAAALEDQLLLAKQLTSQAQETVRARKAAQDEYQREFERIQEEADRAQKQIAEDDRKKAEEQARVALEPFLQAARNIQDALADGIDEALQGRVTTAEDVAEQITSIFRRAIAEGLAAQVIGPEINAVLGTVTGAVRGNANPAAGPTAQAGIFGSATPFIRGGFVGAGVGGVTGGFLGGNAVGSTVGGAVGGAIGSAFGPVGTIIGGVAGGAAGGVFGNLLAGSGGNNRAGGGLNLGTSDVRFGTDSKSQANQDLVNKIVGGLGEVTEFLTSIGGNLPSTDIRLRVGDKSGPDLRIGTGAVRSFDSPQELATETIREIVRLAKNIPDEVRQAALRSQANTADKLLEDIQFGAAFQKLVTPVTDLKAQFDALEQSFDQAAIKTKQLGLDEQALADARGKALGDFLAEVQRGIDAVVEPGSIFKQQLEALKIQFDDAAKIAKDFGLNEAEVAAGRQRAINQVTDAARDAFDSVVSPTSAFRQQIDGLNAAFDEALIVAKEFGFSEQDVSRGRQRAIEELTANARTSFEQLVNPATEFLAQLQALNQRFDEAAKLARDLGINEKTVADARSKAIADLVRDAEDSLLSQRDTIIATFDGLLDPIRGTIEALQFGNLTALSPQDQLAQAQTEFRDQLRLAQGGNEDAIRALPDIARTFASEAREFNASGQIFQDAFREINEGLNGVLDAGERRQQDILSQLPDAIRNANVGVIAALQTQTRDIVNELASLRRDIALLKLPA